MATVLEHDTDTRTRTVELVLAAQQGDRAAFGELFERYADHVLAVALRRLGDYNEAVELRQDVFLQAMQKLGQLRQPAAFAGWLRSITHRMAINRMVRRPAVVNSEPELLDASCADHQTPVVRAMEGERSAQLRVGLSRLREMDRETLEAFYVQGQSLLEMSVRFDAPLGTIKRRLHVARKRLAEELTDPVAV